jgi:hypothetical protein
MLLGVVSAPLGALGSLFYVVVVGMQVDILGRGINFSLPTVGAKLILQIPST